MEKKQTWVAFCFFVLCFPPNRSGEEGPRQKCNFTWMRLCRQSGHIEQVMRHSLTDSQTRISERSHPVARVEAGGETHTDGTLVEPSPQHLWGKGKIKQHSSSSAPYKLICQDFLALFVRLNGCSPLKWQSHCQTFDTWFYWKNNQDRPLRWDFIELTLADACEELQLCSSV